MYSSQHSILIILSTGRTGTKFLSYVLSNLDIGDISHQDRYSRVMNIVGNLGLCSFFESPSKKLLQYILAKTDRKKSTADPLLSIPHLLLMNHNNKNCNLRFLHVLRDPREFVTSFMNWRKQKLRRLFLHHWVPFWQPNPWSMGDAGAFEYLRMSKFEHFCWIWSFKNTLFEQVSKESKTEYLRIRFEDIAACDETESFNKLASFLNSSPLFLKRSFANSQAKKNASKKYFPRWQQWTNKQALTLHKHCGPLMEKYGYGTEPEWLKLLENKMEK